MELLRIYKIHLKSISPLIMNCDTLANPLHPLSKEIKQFTGLKKKQDEHHLLIGKLQWKASLYYDEEIGIYLSTKMIFGCFKASARKEKMGMLMKAVIIDCFPGTPLIPYQGLTPETLWEIKNKKGELAHVFVETVNVQQSKTMRTRPIFFTWEVKFNLQLNTEILAEKELQRIIERAGQEYGFGELRPQLANGHFGRFTLEKMEKV